MRAEIEKGIEIYTRHRRAINRTIWAALLLSLVRRVRDAVDEQKSATRSLIPRNGKSEQIGIDRQFFKRLKSLLKIVIPGIKSKEFGLLITHSCFLVLRTLLSLYLATLDGRLVASLVKGNGRDFIKGIAYWMLLAIPSCYTNSMLSYLQSKLAIAYRTRLTTYIHKRYLHGMTFYALTNLDDRIVNADGLITQDVKNFSTALSMLYSNLAKPILDMAIYNFQLSRNVGGEGLFLMGLLVQLSANVILISSTASDL